MERVQRHEADRLGIRVDDAQVDQATQAIAARNKIGVDQLRKEIENRACPGKATASPCATRSAWTACASAPSIPPS